MAQPVLSESTLSVCLAAERGDLQWLAELLAQGADPSLPDELGRTPLMLALAHGHEDCAEFLLDLTPEDLNARDREGEASLGLACRFGLAALARMLLERGARPTRDAEGLTPLMRAARLGHLDCVDALLAWSNEEERDPQGCSLAHLARVGGHASLASFFEARALARHEARLFSLEATGAPAAARRL
jgi:ankyrin repeat protein